MERKLPGNTGKPQTSAEQPEQGAAAENPVQKYPDKAPQETAAVATGDRTGAAKKPAEKPAEKPTEERVEEIGGPPGPEPTRYGDWQFKGRVTDF